MAEKHDLTIDKGATFKLKVVWKDSAGVVINLTGYSVRMQIRESYDSTKKIVDITNLSGITVTPLSGQMDILITDTITKAIRESSGVYDLEVESGGGETTRLIEGKVNFTPEVTR